MTVQVGSVIHNMFNINRKCLVLSVDDEGGLLLFENRVRQYDHQTVNAIWNIETL